ncbi:hypothetical protein JXB28_02635 [Candidatus Woesearchaeota archaeon]|nr:hypothetical protein [Candidatus Woesearchaeota archaeon]
MEATITLAIVAMVSCLMAGMYSTSTMHSQGYEESLRGHNNPPKNNDSEQKPEQDEKKKTMSDLEKMALSELPEKLEKKPSGILGELYVKKEIYFRKDLA